MTQEYYINFEQAKALKELGFPQLPSVRDNYLFGNSVPYVYEPSGIFSVDRWNKSNYTVVPLSLVQTWLRKEKKIILWVEPEVDDDDSPSGWLYDFKIICPTIKNIIVGGVLNENFETVLSTGIDKTIELLNVTNI